MKKLILLSLMFGGMGIVDAYASAKSAQVTKSGAKTYDGVIKITNKEIDDKRNALINLNDGVDYEGDYATKIIRALLRTDKMMEEDILNHIKGDKITIGSCYSSNSTSEQSLDTMLSTRMKPYAKQLALNLQKVINDLLSKYGIDLDVQENKDLLQKLENFYSAHSRQYVTINPVIKIQSYTSGIKNFFWKGYEQAHLGQLYMYNNAHNGLTNIAKYDKGTGRGDISFVLVKPNDTMKKLTYRVYADGTTSKAEARMRIERFLDKKENPLNDGDWEELYDLAVLNNIKGKYAGNGYGTKVYKPRYMDYLGVYNTKVGDWLFDKVTNAMTHSGLFYFYHKELKDKDHLVGFYIMKASLFGKWKKGWGAKYQEKSWDSRELTDDINGIAKGTTVAKHRGTKNWFYSKLHDPICTPFFSDELTGKGVAIVQSTTKEKAFYVMRISEDKYKTIINSEDYKNSETTIDEIMKDKDTRNTQVKWRNETNAYKQEMENRKASKKAAKAAKKQPLLGQD